MTTDAELAKILLYTNCGYTKGDSVVILEQRCINPPKEYKDKYQKSTQMCTFLYETYTKLGIDVQHIIYEPTQHQNGVDAPIKLYELTCDILLMPTAFSLTHTNFRKHMTKKGVRVMSMPTFERAYLQFLEQMQETIQLTTHYYTSLKKSKKVILTAHNTNIECEIQQKLIFKSAGLIDEDGTGQVPGAETYCVPKDMNGYFTIPKGYGGSIPVEYDVTFHIKDGLFVDFTGKDATSQSYIDTTIRPLFAKPGFNVVAELGIGTNPNITAEFLHKYGWSTLLAEKIYTTAHIANGNSKAMGGENDVPIHIDWVIPDVTITFE